MNTISTALTRPRSESGVTSDGCLYFAHLRSLVFDHDLRLRKLIPDCRQQFRQVRPDRPDIERLLAGKVGDAESASDVEHAHRGWRVFSELQCKFDGLLLCFPERIGAQVLRTAEDMEALEIEAELPDTGKQ